MIRVFRNYDSPPPAKLKDCWENIKNKVLAGKKSTIDLSGLSRYYGHKTVDEALGEIYYDKCAYCESSLHLEINYPIAEHYRPKKRVRDWPDKRVISIGYYWLVCEWSNLLPVCNKCNVAKSDYFPIAGVRVDRHGSAPYCFRADSPALLAEQPLLLNPETDRPEEHLIFLPNGRIKGITPKGKATVSICDLNRDRLVLARKTIVETLLKDIRYHLAFCAGQGDCNKQKLRYALKLTFFKILKMQSPVNDYSRLGWFMFKKFNLFFIDPLTRKERSVVLKAFELFCANGL